ncbi:MAG: hypothetical protein V4543_17285 [Bacteroidota bacterium]
MQKNKIIILITAVSAAAALLFFALSRPGTPPVRNAAISAKPALSDTVATTANEPGNANKPLLEATLPLTAEELAKAAAYPATATYGHPFRFSIKSVENHSNRDFSTPEKRKIYLLADADTHWVLIDSTIADTNGFYSLSGIVPGKGMYMLVQDTAGPEYPRLSETELWSVLIPLDSNKVLLRYTHDEEEGFVPAATGIDELDQWRTFTRKSIDIMNPKDWATAVKLEELGDNSLMNQFLADEQDLVYEMAPSFNTVFAYKFAGVSATDPGGKKFLKKLLTKLKTGGKHPGRIAALEQWVKAKH